MQTQAAPAIQVPTPADLRLEDDWIGRRLACLDTRIVYGELIAAAQDCQRLLTDLESHCVAEEGFMARIDFPGAPEHCADHVALLVTIARMLRELRGAVQRPHTELQEEALRHQLADAAYRAHIHVVRQDARLQRFAARAA